MGERGESRRKRSASSALTLCVPLRLIFNAEDAEVFAKGAEEPL